MEDLSFLYRIPESTPGGGVERGGAFDIKFERKQGSGGLLIQLTNPGLADNPIRMLMTEEWPPASHTTMETFDIVSKAIFESLPGDWQIVMAEVRIRAQLPTTEGAMKFLRKCTLKIPSELDEIAGNRVSFASVRIEADAATHLPDDPLANPRRILMLEVLRQDTASIFSELVCQWPQIPAAPQPMSVEANQIRPFDVKPSEYIENGYEFLNEAIRSFSASEEKK